MIKAPLIQHQIATIYRVICFIFSPNESKIFRCARKVSTVLCVHEPECHPSTNCSGHGKCVLGECQCEKNWAGQACDQLQCGKNNCSGNGKCTEGKWGSRLGQGQVELRSVEWNWITVNSQKFGTLFDSYSFYGMRVAHVLWKYWQNRAVVVHNLWTSYQR